MIITCMYIYIYIYHDTSYMYSNISLIEETHVRYSISEMTHTHVYIYIYTTHRNHIMRNKYQVIHTHIHSAIHSIYFYVFEICITNTHMNGKYVYFIVASFERTIFSYFAKSNIAD